VADAKIIPIEKDPVPIAQGTFAIFEKPDGGIHLAVRNQNGEEHHIEAPSFMVELMKSGEMSPLAILKALRRNRKDA
jgi:hypothetical protein